MTENLPDFKPQKRSRSVYGDLVARVQRRSGRSKSTIYAVLRGDIVSAPVRRAIREALAEIEAEKRKAG
jgi:hypothetical protein